MNYFKRHLDILKNNQRIMKEELLELLKEHGNYLGGDILRFKLGLKSTVEVRALINELRTEGNPIIAGKHGYKYTESKIEIETYRLHLQGRIRAMNKALQGINDYLES